MYLDRARHKVEGRHRTTLTFPAKKKKSEVRDQKWILKDTYF